MTGKYYHQTILFFAIAAFILNSCGSQQRVPPPGNIKVSPPWIFSFDFEKGLYKTEMLIYGNELSGLTFIKNLDSSYRVVCMSEVGLKFYDIEFFTYRNQTKVHHIADFLNRQVVLDKLENIYYLLFMVFDPNTKERYYNDETQSSMVKEYKVKGEESRYYYDNNFGMVSSIRQKRKGTQLRLYTVIHDHICPQTINGNQENLNLRLERIEP